MLLSLEIPPQRPEFGARIKSALAVFVLVAITAAALYFAASFSDTTVVVVTALIG